MFSSLKWRIYHENRIKKATKETRKKIDWNSKGKGFFCMSYKTEEQQSLLYGNITEKQIKYF